MLKLIKEKSPFWQINGTYYLNEKPYYIRSKSTKCIKKIDAQLFLTRFLNNIQPNTKVTVEKAIDEFLKVKKPTKDKRRYFIHLKRLSNELRIIDLNKITDDDVQKFIYKRYPEGTEIGNSLRKYEEINFNEIEFEERKKLSSNNNTINSSLISPLQSLIKFGNTGNRDWCRNFVFTKLSVLNQEQREKFFWLKEEVLKCTKHDDYEIVFLLVFLFRTGFRLQEALDLNWQNTTNQGLPIIDLDNKIIRVFQNKTKNYREQPIHENYNEPELSLWHWLQKINNREGYLFSWKNLQDKKNSNKGIGVRWNKMCKFAGIDPKKKRHSARHGFASIIGNNGGSDKDIQSLGGWKTKNMVTNYTHIELQRKRKILNTL